jgi:4-amino-4-deoxy-L-arabinose transferase-like glycosyltransferase
LSDIRLKIDRPAVWLYACALVIAAGLVFNLAGYPLLDPDEGRNAEVAREMAATNDYALPHLNALPYLDKPVLFFAAAAFAVEVLGPTELAVRLPPLLFTLATLVIVAWFGLRLFGAAGAWTAAVATAATPFTLAYARTVIFDSALTLWVVLALVGFYWAVERAEPREEGRPGGAAWWAVLAWAALALGVLTKGPIALALPLMVAVPFALWRKRLRPLFEPVAVLLFVSIVLPWVVAVSRVVPEFLEYALVTETARRLTTTELNRTGPFWYFLAILPAAALPWSVAVVAALVERLRARRGIGDPVAAEGAGKSVEAHAPTGRDPRLVYLALWIVVPLLFFSLSQSKRPQYLLPLIPAVGLLLAALWEAQRARMHGARAAAAALAVLGAFLLLARGAIAGWISTTAAVAAAIPGTALALGAVCLAAGAAAWISASRREVVLLSLSLPVAAIPFVSVALMSAIGADRSAAALAAAIEREVGRSAEVVAVRTFPLGLPFYLRHPVVLATDDASELTSNYLVRRHRRWRDAPGSTLRSGDWWREALTVCDRPRVFVARSNDVAVRSELARKLPLLAETRKHAAYGPCAGALMAQQAR